MFEVSHRTEVVKCPNPLCKENIQLSIGKVPGGVNDSGGWILQCDNCSTKFPYKVKESGRLFFCEIRSNDFRFMGQ